jgi:predicted transcriptional regulator
MEFLAIQEKKSRKSKLIKSSKNKFQHYDKLIMMLLLQGFITVKNGREVSNCRQCTAINWL